MRAVLLRRGRGVLQRGAGVIDQGGQGQGGALFGGGAVGFGRQGLPDPFGAAGQDLALGGQRRHAQRHSMGLGAGEQQGSAAGLSFGGKKRHHRSDGRYH